MSKQKRPFSQSKKKKKVGKSTSSKIHIAKVFFHFAQSATQELESPLPPTPSDRILGSLAQGS